MGCDVAVLEFCHVWNIKHALNICSCLTAIYSKQGLNELLSYRILLASFHFCVTKTLFVVLIAKILSFIFKITFEFLAQIKTHVLEVLGVCLINVFSSTLFQTKTCYVLYTFCHPGASL